MNCHKPIINSCACSCGCGNSSSPGGNIYTPDDKCDLFCPMRSQELLSTLEEKLDSEVIKSGRKFETRKELELELGGQAVLGVSECWEGASVLPFTWECSNPKVVMVSPTQSLSQAQVMGLMVGEAYVKSTCVLCPCERIIIWKITVKDKTTLPSPTPPPSCPCSPPSVDDSWCPCPPCHQSPSNPDPCCECESGWGDLEEWKLGLKKGGPINLPFNLNISQPIILHKETWLDLGGHEIITHQSLPGGKFIVTERDGGIREGEVIDHSEKGNFGVIISYGSLTLENLRIETKNGITVNVMEGAEVNIMSGKYTSLYGPATVQTQGGKINIFGGVFECPKEGKIIDILPDPFREIPDESLVTIQGGKFLGYDPRPYVPSGYKVEIKEVGFDTIFTVLQDSPTDKDEWGCGCRR